MADAQLAVRDVHGWYGESHVLHGMSFDVNAGEVVTLLGRNGAGKTTTMRAIMGMLANRKGSITYEGRELIRLKSEPHRPARHRLLSRGARHFREPQRLGEPDAAARWSRAAGCRSRRSTSCFPT